VIIVREKEAYCLWQKLHHDFPKTERFGLGQKIDLLFIEILELSFSTVYLPAGEKIPVLEKIIPRLDILKFFLQLAWEIKLFSDEKQIEMSGRLAEIGRMLGGWKKGLQNKTPPKTGGGERQ